VHGVFVRVRAWFRTTAAWADPLLGANNPIGDEGAVELARALAANRTLPRVRSARHGALFADVGAFPCAVIVVAARYVQSCAAYVRPRAHVVKLLSHLILVQLEHRLRWARWLGSVDLLPKRATRNGSPPLSGRRGKLLDQCVAVVVKYLMVKPIRAPAAR